MMDYRHLEALAAVINENGFEKASKKLNITQSAVSQRIKQLEDLTGQILIIRKSPPRPTDYGKKLLKHFMLVEKLETELLNEIHENKEQEFLNIAIGINADSLATWFIDSCSNFLETHKVTMDLRIDDQDETHIMLKNGEVLGCIGSKKLSIQGCCSTFLGNMKYRPVAAPDFNKNFFKKGFNKETIKTSPCVLFNKKDGLQAEFFKKAFQTQIIDFPRSYIPSSEKFFDFILKGHAYGMVPDLQSQSYLKTKKLIALSNFYIEVPLYWSRWTLNSKIIKTITDSILKESKKFLSQ